MEADSHNLTYDRLSDDLDESIGDSSSHSADMRSWRSVPLLASSERHRFQNNDELADHRSKSMSHFPLGFELLQTSDDMDEMRCESYTNPLRPFKNLLVVCIGHMLFSIAYISLRNLQSSINHEKGLGVTSLACIYGGFVFGCVFTTAIVHRFGPKFTLVASILFHVAFSLANAFPSFYSMVPASAIAGISQAAMWTALGTYLTHIAKVAAQLQNKSSEATIGRYFGMFFVFDAIARVVGSLVTSVVMEFAPMIDTSSLKSSNDSSNSSNSSSFNSSNWTNYQINSGSYSIPQHRPSSFATTPKTTTTATPTYDPLAPSLDFSTVTSSVPPPPPPSSSLSPKAILSTPQSSSSSSSSLSLSTSYFVSASANSPSPSSSSISSLSSTAAASVTTSSASASSVPPPPLPLSSPPSSPSNSITKSSSPLSSSSTAATTAAALSATSSSTALTSSSTLTASITEVNATVDSKMFISVQEDICGPKYCHYTWPSHNNFTISPNIRFLLVAIFCICLLMSVLLIAVYLDSVYLSRKFDPDEDSFSTDLASTIRLWTEPSWLLLTPLIIYCGILISFISADVTKAFMSCFLGVDALGYLMTSFGLCAAAASLMSTYVVPMRYRTMVYTTVTVLNLLLLLWMRFWKITSFNDVLVYVLSGFLGVTEGLWTTYTNSLPGILFSENLEAAYSNFQLVIAVAMMTGYSYAHQLCMVEKIYLNAAACITAYIAYLVLQKFKKT
ncbi:UNC93-like protein [Octopus sinensis]|uniref:UNC93-like protein n=1 Tax=Octopus sinensis TaxID=2607531 RepID=A0A6P7SIE4_9MOLL|nr:UNC93-like protein [Octopus sinensis]XP_036359601.1 UNC93-like protein [Octopus sinensis]